MKQPDDTIFMVSTLEFQSEIDSLICFAGER
jgi:hypothetical protein